MKSRFIAKRYWIDQGTAMGRSDELAKSYDDCINLSLGDPDLITDELIINKAFQDAKSGHTKYTDFRGDPELRNEICKFYKEEYNMDVKDEEVFVTASACLGMYLTLPGNAFGSCGEGYIRIACTVNVDVLKEAFDRIEKLNFRSNRHKK